MACRPSSATATRSGDEPEPLAGLEFDGLLTGATPDAHDLLVERRRRLDQAGDPQEVLERGAELVRRVHLQLLAEQEQPGKLPCLHDRPFAILPADFDADLERRVEAVVLLGQRHLEHPRLPVVEHEPGAGSEVDRLRPGAPASFAWQMQQTWSLRSGQDVAA